MSLVTGKKFKLNSSVKFDEYMKALGEYQNVNRKKGLPTVLFLLLFFCRAVRFYGCTSRKF